jgi:nicotinate phosphoribosyltransferase
VGYEFRCRNKGVKLGFLRNQVREQVNALANVKLTCFERQYLEENIPFLKGDYLDFLAAYRFDPKCVTVDDKDGDLIIEIEGLWVNTILFEVPILAIVNELYFRATSDFDKIKDCGEGRLREKIDLIRQYPTLKITEFGTRRRYSKTWQEYVYKELIRNCPQVVGTSNIRLAMITNTKAVGTIAHEFFQCHLSLVDRYEVAQKRAMHVWQQEYSTDLGTMLTDTFTVDAFLRDFDIVLATSCSSVRQDSGDEIVFGEKIIAHYNKLGIDPRTKFIVFSNSLTPKKAIGIYKHFIGRIGVSFGIGTDLSNDLGVDPLNIVIKVTSCNGNYVIKISDDPTKAIGDPLTIEMVKKAYGVKL